LGRKAIVLWRETEKGTLTRAGYCHYLLVSHNC
jgi:hypothetical protein